MAEKKYTKEICLELLRSKKQELQLSGTDRLPQRSDFENDEVVAVKAYLGPWPRALEAAGLKEPRGDDRLEKNREKRRRARRRAGRYDGGRRRRMSDESTLQAILDSIKPLDGAAMETARTRQDKLAKPPGSLGRLEELSIQLAGITGKVINSVDQKALLVFCADNGVTEEGVSVAPQSVTAAQTVNLVRHRTGASVIARRFGVELYVCDVGVNAVLRENGILSRKIANGTKNIARGPAMDRAEALRAILAGAETASKAIDAGAQVVGIGEMGIGNTTTSSAVLAALTGAPVEQVTGMGGGLTDEGRIRKQKAIERALSVNRPDPQDPVDVLSKVGGFDLCAMTGAFLMAASRRVPAVIDGFISAVAALCAARLCPDAAGSFVPSHASVEPGYKIAMEELRLKPLFDLQMRLGEGSGCPIAMMILDAASSVMGDMATFEEANIDDTYLDPIRERGSGQ